MYSLIRPYFFKIDAEKAHHLALLALTYLPKWCFKKPQGKEVKAMGLTFPHPVGLAAGLDKNGEYLDGLAKIGFSFIELGTVTPKPQLGNPKPRLFRIPCAQAIINRMGFNNQGVEALVSHLKTAQYQGILGINIGKNKDTSLNNAVDDYLYCFEKVYEYADYVTINISSPNTPELRLLQQGDYFNHLLTQLKKKQSQLADRFQRYVPIAVKISPDEEDETIKEMAQVILNLGVDGIITTNTTASRPLNTLVFAEQGGLSGKPLYNLSTQCLRLLKKYVGTDVTLIGVGGIDSIQSAQEKIDAGASLVQIYTGLIYKGPSLINQLAANIK
ncbi:MAG: quinone-dependent dihydroorotate dehydrogenase [bacterium]|nr:quinone-dependent dihydroorotate dehydrogenase [bacterium]